MRIPSSPFSSTRRRRDTATRAVLSAPSETVSPSSWSTSCSVRTSSLACTRSEEHTSELQSRQYLVCRLLLDKKKQRNTVSTGGDFTTDPEAVCVRADTQ